MSKPTTKETNALTRAETKIRDLAELIAALDRRVPRIERVGETAIARTAARLKSEAGKRIADLIQDSRR